VQNYLSTTLSISVAKIIGIFSPHKTVQLFNKQNGTERVCTIGSIRKPFSGKDCSLSFPTETTAFFIKELGNSVKKQMVLFHLFIFFFSYKWKGPQVTVSCHAPSLGGAGMA